MQTAQKSSITCYINSCDHATKPNKVLGHYTTYFKIQDEVKESKLFFSSLKTHYNVLQSNGVPDSNRNSFMSRFEFLQDMFKDTTVKLYACNLKTVSTRRGKIENSPTNDNYSTNVYSRQQNAAAIIAYDNDVVFIEVTTGFRIEQFFGEQIEKTFDQKTFTDNCLDMHVEVPALNGQELVNFHGNGISLETKSRISNDLANGDSVNAICKRYEVGQNTVYEIKREHNIEASPKDKRNATIISRLLAGDSVATIAIEMNLSRPTVNKVKKQLKDEGKLSA